MTFLEKHHTFEVDGILNLFEIIENMEDNISLVPEEITLLAIVELKKERWHLQIKFLKKKLIQNA